MIITRLHCQHCDTTVEGHFAQPVGPFGQLSPDQIQFLLAFVRNEGRFNRLEVEMGMSYPTLRNRLYDIIRALGYEPGKDEAPVKLSAEERLRILDDLNSGKINAVEAQKLLSGKRNED